VREFDGKRASPWLEKASLVKFGSGRNGDGRPEREAKILLLKIRAIIKVETFCPVQQKVAHFFNYLSRP
jgi:hypothetical protein